MPIAEKVNEKLKYQDYLGWPDDERWEIIDGVAYNMTPAPRVIHQSIVGKLDRVLWKKVEENGRTLFIAPTDVIFDEYNVVQPDIFMVCDKAKITDDNIKGAPDLIIEVTSPSTFLKDKRDKKGLYEKFGVKEYIIVYPDEEIVDRLYLEDNKYSAPDVFNWDETMRIKSIGMDVNLWEIFGKEIKGKKSNKSRETSNE